MKKLILSFSLLILVACNSEVKEIEITSQQPPPGAIQVDYAELMRVREMENVAIIDVRTPGEYQQGHLPTAISVPVDQLANYLDELSQYESIVIYCRTNNRATDAYNYLRNYFDDIYIYYEGYEKCCQ